MLFQVPIGVRQHSTNSKRLKRTKIQFLFSLVEYWARNCQNSGSVDMQQILAKAILLEIQGFRGSTSSWPHKPALSTP